MRNTARVVRRRLLVLATCLVVPTMTARAQSGAPLDEPRSLFEAAADAALPQVRATVRSRSVTLDAASLAALRPGDGFVLNLFDDAVHPVVIDSFEQIAPQTMQWQGHIEGAANSTALIALHKGVVNGLVRGPGIGDFRIRPGRTGTIVDEVNDSDYAPCGCGQDHVVNAAPGGEAEGGIAGPPVTCSEFIDVMVVYTPEARQAWGNGSAAAIEAVAVLATFATNVSYANSQIIHRLRLVHVAETPYIESGDFDTDLFRLRDTVDGQMDEVHALRDQYGADMVDLLVNATEYCGLAFLMSPPDPAFATDAFSVCNTNCANNGYTMAHEFGHNQGCHHDHDNAFGTPAYDFSYGHRFTASDSILYRTVMAYDPGQRIPHFSNPNVLYPGPLTGTPTGVPQGDPQAADNAQTINLTGPVAAQWRPSTVGPSSEWSETTPQAPSDVMANDRFGSAVAVNGQLAIIGASTDDETAIDSGSVYILRYDPILSTWSEEAKFTHDPAAQNDRFGFSVDIVDHEFGEVAIIGAYQQDAAGRDSGAAYIFRNTGSNWTQEAMLVSEDLAGSDNFGRSVSIAHINGDDVAVVGAYLHDEPNFQNCGAAYVFRSSLGWEQEAKLLTTDPSGNDQFGVSVSIAGGPGGEELVLGGAFRDDQTGTDAGAAYVFERSGGAWTQEAKLMASPAAANDHLGVSAAVSFDGSQALALLGAWNSDEQTASNSGAGYVFRREGTSWSFESRFTAPTPGANDNFGNAVDLHASRAIVGAYHTDVALKKSGAVANAGKAYIYQRAGGAWIFDQEFASSAPEAGDELGFTVGISSAHAIIGSWADDTSDGTDAGSILLTSGGLTTDCNGNGSPDNCDIINLVSLDCNANGLPDECEVSLGDCNGNGFPDQCDLVYGTSFDVNGNGIPDECDSNDCDADLAPPGLGDGVVNVDDLLAVISGWGPCAPPPTPCPTDIAPPSGDGVVNVDDLLAVIGAWGNCPQ